MRRYKRTAVSKNCKEISSTPYKNVPMEHANISLSTIDTGSSSPNEIKSRLLRSEKRKKRIRKKKRAVVPLRNTDNEWETRSEKSVKENEENLGNSGLVNTPEKRYDDNACRNLFEDLPNQLLSPEKVRDQPMTHELILESPILQSSRRLRLFSAKNNTVQREKSVEKIVLPVSNFSMTPDVNPREKADDTLIFHREENIQTYSAALKRKKSPEHKPRDSPILIRNPITMSDLLWDSFVEKFHDDFSQYRTPPPARKPTKLTDFARDLPNVSISKLRKIDPLPAGAMRFRMHFDKHSRKWRVNKECELKNSSEEKNNEHRKLETAARRTKIRRKTTRKRERKVLTSRLEQKRIANVYDTPHKIESGDEDIKNISFREFCHRQEISK